MTANGPSGNQLHLSVLSQDDLAAVHLATLEILERTGVFVESAEAKEMLSGAGAVVAGDRVRIPSFLVEDAVRSAPPRVVIGNRDGERCLLLEDNRSYFTGIVDCPEVLDPFSRSRQKFASKDYRLTARVIDACPHLWGGGGGGSASDYPAEVRAQAAFKYSMLHMKKPFMSCPINAQQMADVYDMAAAMAGGYEKLRQAPFIIATAEPVTPLGLFKDATEILLLAARQNLPLVWYPMPSAGTTSPCSPAGLLTIGNAEALAGLVLHQLARRGAPFIYGMMPGMTDLRGSVTQWAYGSPDLALLAAAATDLAHSYGLPMYGTAGCSDAWKVDEQAVAEATILCLMGQLSGANLVHDVGVLAGAMVISPEMMVLCDEVLDMVEHATRRVDTSHEELAVDLIDEVGPRRNYLSTDHTYANFRRFWYPKVFQRVRLAAEAAEEPEAIADRINRKTVEILEKHEVEPLPAETLRELDEMERSWMARIGYAR